MARKWDKERVLEAIHHRQEQGQSLTTVWRDNNSLYQAGWHYFGGWHRALAAAGIEPPQPKWNKKRVLEAIHARHQQGLSLESVCREDTLLYAAAYRHFGGWPKALAAAGIALPRRWPSQRVLAEINARYQETGTIRGIWQNRRLATAAYNRFGSRRAALVAAGIVLPDTPRRTSLTARAVLKAILARHKQGLPLTGAVNPDLVDRARKHFGRWNKALAAAGLSPARPFTPWPQERVVEALRALKRQGQFEDGSTKVVDKNLQSAARRRFGTLRAALVAAGVLNAGETVRRKRKWTCERIIETLQERRLRGLPLQFDSDRRLAMAAWKRFGSWHHALAAAGLRRETGR